MRSKVCQTPVSQSTFRVELLSGDVIEMPVSNIVEIDHEVAVYNEPRQLLSGAVYLGGNQLPLGVFYRSDRH